jgi:predicted signal transduction protein with EAL and GGDEF domain
LQHERFETDTFIYLSAPVGLDGADVRTAAAYADTAGVLDRLCLGYPYRQADADGPALCAAIEAAGLRVALERVGDECRFADFARYPVCAVRFDEALTAAAAGDPRSASILEAMVNLAGNLGITTIATNVAEGSRAALAEIGVQYLGDGDVSGATARRIEEPVRTSSRSQYQGALYGP